MMVRIMAEAGVGIGRFPDMVNETAVQACQAVLGMAGLKVRLTLR